MSPLALTSHQVASLGIALIVTVVVLGAVASMLLTALVARVVIVAVVLVLGALIWQQRAAITDHVRHCRLGMSFLGVHVAAPADVVHRCASVSR